MVEADHSDLSIQRQCDLLGLQRSGYYYQPRPESEYNLVLMRLLDEQCTRTPYYGVRRLHQHLCSLGYDVNIKRIRRLTRLMGLEAIYPKPNISSPMKGHKIYPYFTPFSVLTMGSTSMGQHHYEKTMRFHGIFSFFQN